ncbi:hypothetical protein J2X36_004090 [Methylobacterium sp. BE186]|uniref:hypothetical protein n=1 Tax=Methylobacterium sp. BE186 TaxID=2817715 RepID=UPI002864288E|nr:hypothetical protein [Methylobacterium sp. BE186]MDR7039316.1 hypothetical protein [Methylobacterium sp. BE186]
MDGFRLRTAYLALAGTLALGPARAGERPYTPALACEDVRLLVTRAGSVTLATSPNAYEQVSRTGGVCTGDTTAAPAFVPARDDPACFAGYRCRQRNSDTSY